MKIVMLSDTHGEHRKVEVPDGDILIHAGDSMADGMNPRELEDLNDWFGTLPHPNKILIAGNHDLLFEKVDIARGLITNATYLQDEYTHVNGLKIYGSPWQPEFFNWAFNLPRGAALKQKWDMIPDDTDILVTHGPPFGYQDHVPRGWKGPEHVGCGELLARVKVVKPIIHVFGHIHAGAGYTQDEHTTYVNAAVVDGRYKVRYNPTVITLESK
jgi:Icc-related predicted phosphoesterase